MSSKTKLKSFSLSNTLDLLQAFIGCAAGIGYVSLCVICYGIVGGVFAVITGKLANSTGRVPIFVTGKYYSVLLVEASVQPFPIPYQCALGF